MPSPLAYRLVAIWAGLGLLAGRVSGGPAGPSAPPPEGPDARLDAATSCPCAADQAATPPPAHDQLALNAGPKRPQLGVEILLDDIALLPDAIPIGGLLDGVAGGGWGHAGEH